MGAWWPAPEAELIGAGGFALCSVELLKEGHARGFDPWSAGFDTVFAVRTEGVVRVYRNRCPHLNVSLEYRKDRFLSADGKRIICYAHGAQFLPGTGECIYGPCLGQFLQGLEIYCEDGWVWLAVDECNQPIEVSHNAMGRIPVLD